MTWFRKWLILVHRYLGIALSLLFVVWFLSGIGMIYAKDMPRLTPELRLERLPPLDFAKVRLTPSEAVERAEVERNPRRVVLLTALDRPAYRFTVSAPVVVFADTGDLLEEVNPTEAVTIASQFTRLPVAMLHHAGVLTTADQWTIAQRRQMPLHKVVVEDDARTELYVSEQVGEVVVYTTRGSRALAWVAAIPHWIYFAPLRRNDTVWRQVVLWTSGLGAFLALVGLTLAVIQFSPSRPFRISRVLSYNPYTGWMRWHYITGVLFGFFTLTWVFSGMLSIQPWDWASGGGSGAAGIRQSLAGGPLELSLFPPVSATAWNQALDGRAVKEVEFVRIQGAPHYVVRGAEAKSLLVEASPLQLVREPFSTESVMTRVKQGNPGVPIVEAKSLSEYDAYYYSRDSRPPLPVLRVKFDDPDRTWFYVDPSMSQLLARFTRRQRLERWIYHGFHSLDFSFLYYNRPLWYVAVIALSVGGALSSGIGLFVGMKRVLRGTKRTASRWGRRSAKLTVSPSPSLGDVANGARPGK